MTWLLSLPWGFILRIAGPAAVLAVAWLHGCSTGQAGAERKHQLAVAEMRAAQAEVERLKGRANLGVTDAYRKQAQAAAVAAAGARGELERLRDELAAAAEHAPTGPGTDAAAALGTALAECAGRYQEVAGAADTLAAQVEGLQRYAREVCVAR